jgi:class 3 adenylate cyclase/tetratricopeptide (TPR) repeat protein
LIICGHCGAGNEDGARFCDACGQPVASLCPACTAPVRPSARFCNQCRHPLNAAGPAQPAPPAPTWSAEVVSALDEGGRKQVTILFCDVRGSTALIESLDPEAAMLQLDPTIELMCQAIARAGGTVNRIEGDGVMALFGAPMAWADHAVRACLAARDILDRVAQGDGTIAVRVGVASGEVVIRPTGRDASDWDAVGIAAHLARRLEQLAKPGTALIAATTARLTRGFTELASVDPIMVKGATEPVEMYELLSATARPSWEVRASAQTLNRFVGRESELAQLMAAATRASFGRGRVVTVVGDAGVGKSRLMHEFLRAVPSGSWHVLRVAAVSYATNAPYHLAAEALRAWIGVETQDERPEIARKLARVIALLGEGLDAVPLRALLDLPVEDLEWPTLEVPLRRARVLSALRLAVLREAAIQPLVLMVEDLHWADQSSLEMLEAIVDGLGAARLLVVATTRPPSDGAARGLRWSSRSYSSELRLNPLGPEDAEALLEELLGHDPALAGLRQEIVERSEGTPLFLEEIARSLNERGVIETSRPRLQPGIAGIGIPASIQAVLAERLDRLPADRRRLLQLASVIGKDIPLDLLRRMTDLPEDRLAEELTELQAGEFIYELHLPSGLEYTFKHALTQTVAYEGMLRRHRRDLHARAFAAMEALYADRLDETLGRLAEHAFKGEVWEQAYTYSLRAGRRASGSWAWREAIVLLEQALEALSHLPASAQTTERGIEVRLDLRVALGPTGDFQQIRQRLVEARDLAAAAGNDLKLAQVDTSRCISLSLLGGLNEAVEAGRQALAAATRFDDPASKLNAIFALGQAYWYRGDIAEGERVLLAGLPLVRGKLRLQRTGTTGSASVLHLVCLSKTYALGGDADAAAAFAAEAIEVADQTRRPYDLAYARVAEGFHHFMLDDHDAAVVAFEAGLAFCRGAGIALLVSSIARYLGRSYVAVGRGEDARALLAEALAQSSTHGLIAFRTWCAAGLAHTHLPDVESSAAHFTSTMHLARQHGYRPVEAHAMHMLGVLGPRDGPMSQAASEAWLRQSLQLSEALGLRPLAAVTSRELAARLTMPIHASNYNA